MSGRTVNITPGVLGATYVVPADGEDIDSASIEEATALIAGGVATAQSRLTVLEGLVPGSVAANFYTVRVPVSAYCVLDVSGPAGWFMSYATFGTRPFLSSNDTTSADVIFDLSPYLPQQGKIVQVDVLFRGSASRTAGLPGTMPQRILYSQAYDFTSGSDPAPTALSAVTDSSASLASFNKLHAIGGFMTHFAIDNSLQYLLRVIGPDGANLASGDQILGIDMIVSGG